MESLKGFYRINEEDYYPIDEAISVKEVRQDIEEFVGDNPEKIDEWDMLACKIGWYMTIISYNMLPEEELEDEKNEDMLYINEIIEILYKRIKDLGGKIDRESFHVIVPEGNGNIVS